MHWDNFGIDRTAYLHLGCIVAVCILGTKSNPVGLLGMGGIVRECTFRSYQVLQA